MRFPKLKTLVLVCAAAGLIAGNVYAADKPIKSFADVKGTWTGTATGPRGGSDKVTVTIKEDGTYSASSWDLMGGGKLKLADGKMMWQGSGGNTGSAVLSEDGELVISGDQGKGFAVLKKKKK